MHKRRTLDQVRTSEHIPRQGTTERPIRTSRSIPINTGRGRMTWSRVKETEEMALKRRRAGRHRRSCDC